MGERVEAMQENMSGKKEKRGPPNQGVEEEEKKRRREEEGGTKVDGDVSLPRLAAVPTLQGCLCALVRACRVRAARAVQRT